MINPLSKAILANELHTDQTVLVSVEEDRIVFKNTPKEQEKENYILLNSYFKYFIQNTNNQYFDI